MTFTVLEVSVVPRRSSYKSIMRERQNATRRDVADGLQPVHDRLVADLREAMGIEHSGERGGFRENAVRKLLQSRLPGRFGVTAGEVIDINGSRSRQLDVIIYDALNYSPLVGGNRASSAVLPVEAVLAVVEVKSLFDKKSMVGSSDSSSCILENAHSVFRLKFEKKNLVRARKDGEPADDASPRIHYSVVALQSDLEPASWPRYEVSWMRDWLANPKNANKRPWINMIVALDRGILYPDRGQYCEFADQSRAAGFWLFNLMNFLTREAARRTVVHWNRYQPIARSEWRSADFGL